MMRTRCGWKPRGAPISPAMRSLLVVLALAGIGIDAARANVVIAIDKSQQRMSVSIDGEDRYTWPISTARAGYVTPNGTYHPELLARRWFSHKYYGSPMPHSIFFHGRFAIHGSYEISRLGRAASPRRVRLRSEQPAERFALVREVDFPKTETVVTGSN